MIILHKEEEEDAASFLLLKVLLSFGRRFAYDVLVLIFLQGFWHGH